MADRKLSASTAITAAEVDLTSDQLLVLDVSDTTDGAGGTTKKLSSAEAFILFGAKERLIGATLDRRYSAACTIGALASITNAINVLRAAPVVFRRPITIDKFGIEITTGVSGNIIVGIYDSNTDGSPNSLKGHSGVLAITAPGVYEGLSGSQFTLQPGLYWITYTTNTANIARAIQTTNIINVLGAPSSIGSTNLGAYWNVARTYDGTLPSTFTAGGTIAQNLIPYMFFRCV